MGKKDICPTFFNGVDCKLSLHAIFAAKHCPQTLHGHQELETSKHKYFDQN